MQGLDRLAEALSAAATPVQWDDDFPGHRRFYAHDPHGDRLEFLEPLPDGLDEAASAAAVAGGAGAPRVVVGEGAADSTGA